MQSSVISRHGLINVHNLLLITPETDSWSSMLCIFEGVQKHLLSVWCIFRDAGHHASAWALPLSYSGNKRLRALISSQVHASLSSRVMLTCGRFAGEALLVYDKATGRYADAPMGMM